MSNYREAFLHFRNGTRSVVCSAIYMQSKATPYRMGTCLRVHVQHLTTLATLDKLTCSHLRIDDNLQAFVVAW
jgi:hypothetical protein